MRKLNVLLGVILIVTIIVACEKDSSKGEEQVSEEVSVEEIISDLNKEKEEEPQESGNSIIYVENLQDIEGLWEVKEIRNKQSGWEFVTVDSIDPSKLSYPVTSTSFSDIKFIKLEGDEISLIDTDRKTILNSFKASNYVTSLGTLIRGLFILDLSAIATTNKSSSRLVVISVNGDLRLGQPSNRNERLSYRLEKVN
ncbi:hypothetical protein [Maribacter sp. 2308TA10-17]|uniref:hypothetical protein n=1 Tax=Maribacter sp. 2308TA10-17 TaxID=3386276 RepID=UPI0039BCEE48